MRVKYRITIDNNDLYEVQHKKWWFPFAWIDCFEINVSRTIDGARKLIIEHKKKNCSERYVVEYID